MRALHLVALVTLLLLSTWHSVAQAESPARPTGQSLHINPDDDVKAIAAAPPTSEHPWGTILIAWCESDVHDNTVHLGEWSLQAGRWLSAGIVRHRQTCPATLRLAWSGPRLVFAIGTDPGPTELIILERDERLAHAGLGFAERQKIIFQNAEAPSLDVDDRFIALAAYEQTTPLDADTGDLKVRPAYLALHVRLFEPTTLRIVSERVFTGDHLLRRHSIPEYAGHAVRLLAGRLYVALADREPRIVATRLPSLATDFERTFVVPRWLRSINSSSIVLNRVGDNLLIAIDATYLLSPKLENVAKTDRAWMTSPIAYDTATRRVLTSNGAPATLDGWQVRVVPVTNSGQSPSVLFAHGRGVVLGDPRGTIRVLP